MANLGYYSDERVLSEEVGQRGNIPVKGGRRPTPTPALRQMPRNRCLDQSRVWIATRSFTATGGVCVKALAKQ